VETDRWTDRQAEVIALPPMLMRLVIREMPPADYTFTVHTAPAIAVALLSNVTMNFN